MHYIMYKNTLKNQGYGYSDRELVFIHTYQQFYHRQHQISDSNCFTFRNEAFITNYAQVVTPKIDEDT